MAIDRKNLKGYGHNGDDDAQFLKVENARGNWVAGASGHGYSARYSDDSGHVRGANHDDSDSHGLRNQLPYERTESPNQRFADLIDSSEGMGSGNALTGGGGPLTQRYGVGSGKPYPPKKPGPQSNADDF